MDYSFANAAFKVISLISFYCFRCNEFTESDSSKDDGHKFCVV